MKNKGEGEGGRGAPSPEARRPAPRSGRQRPPLSYNSWILLTVTVSLVLLMSIITWYGRFPGRFGLDEPSDHEVVHRLALAWQGRWPQVPGPPEEDVALARERLLRDAAPAEALSLLTRALALDPDAPEPLLLLVIASSLAPNAEGGLSPAEADALLGILAQTDAGHPLLPAGRAAQALRLDAGPDGVVSALGALPPDTAAGALVWLQSLQAAGEDARPAADALLALSPGATEGCAVVARAHLAQRQLADAIAALEPCPGGAVLDRLRGAALDGVGRWREAADAYRAAGALLHAAAIVVQEEGGAALSPEEQAALSEPAPEAALHRLWWGILADEPARVTEALEALSPMGAGVGLELDVAQAAGELFLGQPEAALARLEGIGAAEALAVSAQARWQLGDAEGARAAVAQAQAALPEEPRLRLLAALVGPEAGGGVTVAMDALLQQQALRGRYRQRDLPWAALVPDKTLAPLGPSVLEEPSTETILAVLREGAGEGEGEGVMGWLQGVRLAAGPVERGVLLREAALAHPEAAGLQVWLLSERSARGGGR